MEVPLTKQTNLVALPVVLHEELVPSLDVRVEVPKRCTVSGGINKSIPVQYQAIARSAVLASHSNNGLTTPGLKNVPIPGCANKS